MTQDSEGIVSGQDAATLQPKPARSTFLLMVFGLCTCMFLSALETTIVSTSLLDIVRHLGGGANGQWIIVAYLLTYNAFQLSAARLSDIFGRKTMLMTAILIFALSSLACAVSQTMTQLIIFRAFQGIGGSFIYSLVFVVVTEVAPPEQVGLYTSVLGSVFALANLLGPILGGVIANSTTWRWVFWLNLPGCAIASSILMLTMSKRRIDTSVLERLREFDIAGAVWSVVRPIPLIFAVQEGGLLYSWGSGPIAGCLTAGIVLMLGFGAFEVWIDHSTRRQPTLPIYFFRDRLISMTMLFTGMIGVTFYVTVIEIPQRFQVVNKVSPQRAGLLMLPLTLMVPTAGSVGGFLSGKYPSRAAYVALAGSVLVLVGVGLLGSLPKTKHIQAQEYGYLVLVGIGQGLSLPPIVLLMKLNVPAKDLAAAVGTNNFTRTFGGCLGLAIMSAVFRDGIQTSLSRFLSPSMVAYIVKSGDVGSTSPSPSQGLSETQIAEIRRAYGQAYNLIFLASTAFAGLGVFAAVMLIAASWSKKKVVPVAQNVTSSVTENPIGSSALPDNVIRGSS